MDHHGKEKAVRIVREMMAGDRFSQWLGISIIECLPGSCTIRMQVKEEMLNGFGIAHGGICYSLADSALAFASNSHGKHAVSVETSISHTARVVDGDVLTARAVELQQTTKFAVYHIPVTNQDGNQVAVFKGTVYKSGKLWEPD
jgi:acyl-CoA thioesterase